MDGDLWVVSMTAAVVVGIVVAMNALHAHGFAYDACDIPPDMTIADFRAGRVSDRAGRSSVLRRLARPLQALRTRL